MPIVPYSEQPSHARPNEFGSSVPPSSDRSFQTSQTRRALPEKRLATRMLQEGASDLTPNSLSPMEQPQSAQPEPQHNQLPQEHTQQPAQEGNATGPATELTSQTEWKQWLESNIEGFAGNTDNAATLMAALNEGKSYVHEKLTRRGLAHFVRPHSVILFQDSAMSSPIGAYNGQAIVAKKSYLERVSNYDMQAMSTVMRADGAIVFQGTLPDMFRLAGVEETHHTAFKQIKKDLAPGIDPLSTTVAEYDASEDEYRALKWQVRYAEERHMPSETINLLRERLAAAHDVRANKQK